MNQLKPRIFVVDDSPDNLFIMETILSEEGYLVDLETDSAEALARIEQDPPDLITTDLGRPGINGYQFIQLIRNNPKLPYIPILVVTAHNYNRVLRALEMGADDFIYKPVELYELHARVRTLLRLKSNIDSINKNERQLEDFIDRLIFKFRIPLVAHDRVLTLIQQGNLGELSPELLEATSTMNQLNRRALKFINSLERIG